LFEIAEAYRLAQSANQELMALREYYKMSPQCSPRHEAVERYLALLYDRKLNEELRAAASVPNFDAANYFMKRNDRKLAEAAIAALSHGHPTVWRTMHDAMLGWQFRDSDPYFTKQFTASLDLRTIGEQLERRPDPQQAVNGDDWFYYDSKFGQYLWGIQEKQTAVYHLNADLEGAPTNSQRQDQLGLFYLDQKEYVEAIRHFELASQLAPESLIYRDHKAKSLS
jgi:hypothetical protein